MLNAVHRHDVSARLVPTTLSSNTVAVATREMERSAWRVPRRSASVPWRPEGSRAGRRCCLLVGRAASDSLVSRLHAVPGPGSRRLVYNFVRAQQEHRPSPALPARRVRWLGDALAPGADKRLAADLRVSVRPEGPDGPERLRRVECAVLGEQAIDPRCRVLGGLDPRDLEPVPRGTACAQVYGGPRTARVTGQLRGVRVSAEFNLSDACRSPARGATPHC
jgi:hypothetical protein